MKVLRFMLAAAMTMAAMPLFAQDFSAPQYAKWGDTPETRKSNILASQFLGEEVANRNYNSAAHYLQQLLASCPEASENIYAKGATLYKNKINRAQSVAEKNVFVDSLILLYDLRLQHFGNHPKRGKVYILDRKAREWLTYKPTDREGIRAAFEAGIAAQVEQNGTADPEFVAIYFKNICEDYSNDIVDAMTVVNLYDANAKYFENLTPDKQEFKNQFDQCFGTSGAASCENIEKIFSAKLASNPEDETVLAQAVSLMERAKCTTPFFFATAEKYYAVKPSSEIAMALAQAFQDQKNFAKANQYLKEALASETDTKEREKLYLRMGILSMSSNDNAGAVDSFNKLAELNPDNGYVPYFLAQCYVSSAKGCEGISKAAVYWLASDMMNKAASQLEATGVAEDASTAENARKMASGYHAGFPSKEECFFNELQAGQAYTIKCGYGAGKSTTVRYR